MWKEIAGFVKATPTWTLTITVVGTIIVWLYKEFKVILAQEYQQKLTAIQRKLELFGKLEMAIASFLHMGTAQAKQSLFDRIGDVGPHLSEDTRRIIRDYYKQGDSLILTSLFAFIEKEMKELDKEKQKIAGSTDNELMDAIFRLLRPLKPIVLLLIIVLSSGIFSLFYNEIQNTWSKIYFTTFSFSLMFAAIILLLLLSVWYEKNLGKQSLYRWFLTFAIILTPCLAFLFWELSVILPVIQGICFVLFIRSKARKQLILH